MLQDRNAHRDAKFLRRVHSFNPNTNDSQTDKDGPQFMLQPEFGWRLTDLSVSLNTLSGAPALIGASSVGILDSIGNPQAVPGVATTQFLLDEFWHRRLDVSDNDLLRNVNGPTGTGFSDVFTISDGFWGVFVVLADNNANISTLARSSLMEFPTEQDALNACPKNPFGSVFGVNGLGRIAIVTINAVGGDFIANTTNTDDALVAAFNTFNKFGYQMQVPIPHTGFGYLNAGGASFLRDPAGINVLGGRGVAGGTDPDNPDLSGDALVVTLREVGGSVNWGDDDSTISVGYRPWPVGGEGLGDMSVSQTPSTFVP